MPTWRRTAVGFGHDIAAADRGSPLADGRGLSSLEAPGLGAGSQREARESPLADPILEAPDAVAVAAEQSDPAGCHHLNDGLAWGLLPIYYAVAGLSVAEIGALAAIYPAVWGVGQLATGALSDRLAARASSSAGCSSRPVRSP